MLKVKFFRSPTKYMKFIEKNGEIKVVAANMNNRLNVLLTYYDKDWCNQKKAVDKYN